jgi:trans-aconitate methyltransferase
MYDYFLGGLYNFPADQAAARAVIAQFPHIQVTARANRAFLGRAVRTLVDSGVRQFLDIGSGIPTEGNVHEIAQGKEPKSRVVYVDLDPVAVAESQEILEGNKLATAIRADLRDPQSILTHPQVRKLIDFRRPIGLLLAAVLHFVPDDAVAYGVVTELMDALPSGSYLAVSHVATESFAGHHLSAAQDVYAKQTATPAGPRNRDEIAAFFAGLDLLPPGVTWLHEWRPEAGKPVESAGGSFGSGSFGGIGRKAA